MFCFRPRDAVGFITVQTSIGLGVEEHTTPISLESGRSFGFFHLVEKRQALCRNFNQCHKCLLLVHSGWFFLPGDISLEKLHLFLMNISAITSRRLIVTEKVAH